MAMNERLNKEPGSLRLAKDRRLAKRMKRGDQRATQAFCDEYLPKLYRYAVTRLPSEADVDDVVQVALTNAARGIATYRGDALLLTWLIQILRRVISKHLSAVSRRDVMVPFLDDEVLRSLVEAIEAPESVEPEAATSRGELIGLVQLALDQLPERYAAALELKYAQGHSSKEIADELGIGDEAAQSLLARARRAFRDVCSEAMLANFRSDRSPS